MRNYDGLYNIPTSKSDIAARLKATEQTGGPKTVKARIPVAIDGDGRWNAAG